MRINLIRIFYLQIVFKLLININKASINILLSYFCCLKANTQTMNKISKTITAVICATVLMAATSCSRKSATGCPTWGKVKQEQSVKRNV